MKGGNCMRKVTEVVPCVRCEKEVVCVDHRTDGLLCKQCTETKENIFNQAVIEIINDKENEYLNAADIVRLARLAEKFYQQGIQKSKIK